MAGPQLYAAVVFDDDNDRPIRVVGSFASQEAGEVWADERDLFSMVVPFEVTGGPADHPAIGPASVRVWR